MAGLSNEGAATLLEGVRTLWLRASLHTADPGTTGLNEVPTAGSYTRENVPWDGAPVSGRLDTSAGVTWNGADVDYDVTHVGFWSADDLTFYGSKALSDTFNLPFGGTLTLETDDIAVILLTGQA